MPRTLLLCFIHGFKVSSQQQQQAIDAPAQQAANKYKFHKGNEDTFHDFPDVRLLRYREPISSILMLIM